jgi:hypothetical protein
VCEFFLIASLGAGVLAVMVMLEDRKNRAAKNF